MKKILFLATYGDFLATFELSNIKLWKELGCEVHCASNFMEKEYNLKTSRLDEIGVIRHELHFLRSPIKKQNLVAYKQLVKLIKKEKIEVIDCHNAVVGAFARIAAEHCNVKKVIYTPHSFFFYKGCPKKNEIIFKNVEKYLARKTDLLIAINKEDYQSALNMKVRGKALYVPGVGIDTVNIKTLANEREAYCKELNVPNDAHIYISVGELINRKNHVSSIKAFAKANPKNSFYFIAGIGELKEELNNLIQQLGMQKKIKLLGYRTDVKSLMKACDVYLFPSYQEGLPVALMEAMACGLPCIASRIRGNVDLIDEGKGGELFQADNINELARIIDRVDRSLDDKKSKMGKYNQEKIEKFDIRNVQKIMKEEYKKLLNNN